jgi:DNA polymerase-3 subunit beta
MKLLINKEAFLAPLQAISGVVEKKQTMPVLSNILISAESGSLTLTGTNTEVELVCQVANVEVIETGTITVPARKLVDVCRTLNDHSQIEFVVQSEQALLKSDRSQFTLSTLPADNFPNVEDSGEELSIELSQSKFKKLLEATSFAMAQQDVRFYLNGMLLELTDKYIRSVSTDGHRLATASIDLETGLDSSVLKHLIVPRKAILELNRLLNDVEESCTILIAENHVRFKIGAFTFTSKLIEGKFPDYTRVIPRGGDKIMIADRLELKSMFTRAAVLSHENIRGIRLQLSPQNLKVFANNPEHEQAEDSMDVTYQDDALEIGFNVSYLIDALNTLDGDSAKLTFSNSNASVLIEPTEETDDFNALYVVMPMRL